MKNSYKGYKLPDFQNLEIPETNTNKAQLGKNGYCKVPNGYETHNIVGAIHNRMAEGLSPLVLITGESQTGKSYTALRIAYELYEKTNACYGKFKKKNVLYNEKQALNSMTSNFNEKEKLPAMKQILIGDELGEQANANDHNSTKNRAWKMILNVMPLLKNCIIGIDPQSNRIDKKIREKPIYRIFMKDKARAGSLGRRYKGVDKKGKDKYCIDYFKDWNVPKPPEKYIDRWKPKELHYKLKKPIEYLEKLKEKNEDTSKSLSEF